MTDSTVTAKPSLKPEHLTMGEWVESRIARFEGRKYDWNALKFQADFDPKYRRAQMRYIGTGATGVASDSNTVQAEHFARSRSLPLWQNFDKTRFAFNNLLNISCRVRSTIERRFTNTRYTVSCHG